MRCRILPIRDIVERSGLPTVTLAPEISFTRNSVLAYTNIQSFEFPRAKHILRQYAAADVVSGACFAVDLEDVVVFNDGTVLFDGQVVQETLPRIHSLRRTDYPPLFHLEEDTWKLELPSPVECEDELVVATTRYGLPYYGHWLAEILPRLHRARHLLDKSAKMLLPVRVIESFGAGMHRTIMQSLDLLGMEFGGTVAIPAEGVRIRRLRYISPLGQWGQLSPWVLQCFGEIVGRAGAREQSRRIYVTREDAGNRRVANEDQVMQVLEPMGFEMIRISEYDFHDQVRIFSSASAIAGPLGSALTNCVFARSGTPIIPLIPAHWDDVFFYDLACLQNQPWSEVRGDISSEEHKLYQRNDFLVGTDSLKEAVASAGLR